MDRSLSLKPGEMSDEDASALFSSSTISMVLTNPRLEDNPIVYANRAFERLTGYTAESIVGRNCRFLQTDETDPDHLVDLREALADEREHATILHNRRANGETFLNALLVSPIHDADGTLCYFVGLQCEIAHDREHERLKEFETMVAEIQHRVKNHLSMILGLIRMQARTSDSPEEFHDLSRRIESLQLLYEEISAAQLVRNDDRIQLGSYLGRVANAIAHLDGRAGVRMNVNVDPLTVNTEKAVRIGLIVSEILTNAMQHAFKGQSTGLVELRVTRTDRDGLRAIITDDGVGLPEGKEWPAGGNLGSRIVKGLANGLDASLTVQRGAVGTVVMLEVPGAN